MAIDIIFYTFDKKENSTKQPSDGDTRQCILKDNCGIINPRIELLLTPAANPSKWNYCYIADFARYYYVRDWTADKRLWVATLEVDVLASWRTEIGNSVLYVSRAASDFDAAIVDLVYPAKLGVDYQYTSYMFPDADIAPTTSNGTFVVGIVNNDDNVQGSVSYYAMTGEQMAAFRAVMLSSIKDWGSISDFTGDVAKAFIDPFQYVVSCMWFPFPISGNGEVNLSFGFWTTDVTAAPLQLMAEVRNFDLARPARSDQQGERGEWLYSSPFGEYYLNYLPWGLMYIDGSQIDASGIHCKVIIDYITGISILEISSNKSPDPMQTSQSRVLLTQSAQVGVQMQLSQVTTDYGGLLNSVNSVATGIARTAIGDYSGIVGVTAGIGDAARSVSPNITTSGATGGIAAATLFNQAFLIARYRTPVDEDNTEQGRPLCQNRTINTLNGYVKVEHGDVSIPATAEELGVIRLKLEGGFYYE